MPNPRGPSGQPPVDAARAEPTPPTIAETVDNVFSRYDANADGALTLAELLAVIDADGTHTEIADRAAATVTAVDTNGDKSLSKAEVTTLVTKLDTDGDGLLERSDRSATGADATAFEQASVLLFARGLHGGPGDGGLGGPGGPRGDGIERTVIAAVDSLFTRYDADTSTTISLSELLAALDPKGTRTDLDAKVTSLFTAVDTNGDAALSLAEITAVVAQFDTDGDGTIERGEHPAADAGDAVQLIGILLHGAHGAHGPDTDTGAV